MRGKWLIGLLGVLSFSWSLDVQGQSQVITFEGLPDWTSLNGQNELYAAQGVEFGLGPRGDAGQAVTIFPVAAGIAQSGTHVLSITIMSGGGEQFVTDVWGHFPIERRSVSMYVGDLGSSTHDIILEAYSADGTLLQQSNVTVTGGTGIHSPVGIQRSSPDISYFHLSTPNPNQQSVHVAVDDLTFDQPASPPPPDFSFNLELPGNVPILPGQSVQVPLVLHRLNLSTGNIAFSVSGLPAGVSGSFAPNPNNQGDQSLFNLDLSAAPGAQAALGNVIVTGTPSAQSAGSTPRTFRFTLVVQGTYVLRVKGIEVTQGTQSFGVPSRGPNIDAPVAYQGVPLTSFGKTVARVFADAVGAPAAGISAGVLLHGFDNSHNELPGSPLLPQSGPAALADSGSAGVTQAEQINANASFDFVIPWSLANPMTLTAELVPPVPSLDHSEVAEPCNDPNICLPLRTLTLTGITSGSSPFTQIYYVDPVLLRVNGQPDPGPPWTAFEMAERVTPAIMAVNPEYVGTVDITDIAQSGDSRSDMNSAAWDALEDWWDDNGQVSSEPYGPGPYFTIGVLGPGNVDLGVTAFNEVLGNPCSGCPLSTASHPIAVTYIGRPLTSIAHELHHCFGRMHASSACGGGTGGQSGEPWPPDQVGFLNGVGIDLRGSAPFNVLATGVPGEPTNICQQSQPGQWYDFMSYCACGGSGDPALLNSWISPKGWNEFWNNPNPEPGSGGSAAARSMAHSSMARPLAFSSPPSMVRVLRVRGYVTDTGVHIASVKQTTSKQPTPPASSPYHLVVRNAQAQVLSDTPMTTEAVNVAHIAVVTFLRAEVPLNPAMQSVAIAKNGTVAAQRIRPPQLPQVKVGIPRVLTPPPGVMPLTGGLQTQIQWQSSASVSAGIRQTVTVDYSVDDGHTWRVLYVGPNRNQVQLPQHYLSAAPRARVRVRINDGFNEVASISDAFNSPGSAPIVHIIQPLSTAKLKSGMPVELKGESVDDRLARIPGLQWILEPGPATVNRAPVVLGAGERLVVASLPPGTNLIRLEARDSEGRVGSGVVQVSVAPNPPEFLILDSPRLVSTASRQVSLHVSSSERATLTIQQIAGIPFGVIPGGPLELTNVSQGVRSITKGAPPAQTSRPVGASVVPPSLALLMSHLPITGGIPAYQVGPQPTTITLNVPADSKPLYFDLTLTADGQTASRTIAIGREITQLPLPRGLTVTTGGTN